MSISATCPGCKSLFKLPDAMAGSSVRCAKCKQLFEVPAVAAPPDPVEPPPEEVEEAELAESPQDEPAKVSPPALPKPAPQERPPSVLVGLALLLVFSMAMLGVGTVATIWTAVHVGPPIPLTSAPLHGLRDRIDVGEKRKDDIVVNKNFAPPWQQVNLDFAGRASLLNTVADVPPFVDHGKWEQDGPYRLLRVHLVQGTTYNFLLVGLGTNLRVRIVDDGFTVTDQQRPDPTNRLMIAFKAVRNGPHFIWINTTDRNRGTFDFHMATESRMIPIPVDLTVQPVFNDFGALLLADPLDPAFLKFGPYHEYEVKLAAGTEYQITIRNATFVPALRIGQGDPVTPVPGIAGVQQTFRPAFDGKYRIRVTSSGYGLGNYTLNIVARKMFPVQPINAVLDPQGAYLDQRELSVTDRDLVGRGKYKEYAVMLEKGKKYRFEMSQGNSLTSLTLFDPIHHVVEEAAGKKDAGFVHVARESGMHTLHAAAPLPAGRQAFQLKITTLP